MAVDHTKSRRRVEKAIEAARAEPLAVQVELHTISTIETTLTIRARGKLEDVELFLTKLRDYAAQITGKVVLDGKHPEMGE